MATAMLSVALVATGANPAGAAQPNTSCSGTDIWNGNAGDDLWTTGGNWSENVPPVTTDAVQMPGNTAIGVNLLGSASICALDFGASDSVG